MVDCYYNGAFVWQARTVFSQGSGRARSQVKRHEDVIYRNTTVPTTSAFPGETGVGRGSGEQVQVLWHHPRSARNGITSEDEENGSSLLNESSS